MDLVVTHNNKSSYAAAKCVRQSKRCATSVTVALEIYRRDVIASTFEKSEILDQIVLYLKL